MGSLDKKFNKDTFIRTRSILYYNVEQILETLSQLRNSKKIASDDLFGSEESDSPAHAQISFNTSIPAKSKLQVLVEEKESLGLYVSGNPLAEYENLVEYIRQATYTDDIHLVIINKIKKIFTKSNQMMFALAVSTPHQELEAVIFPKRALEFSPIIQEKELFWIKGKISQKQNKTNQKMNEEGEIQEYDELPKLLIDELRPFRSGVLELFTDSISLSESSLRRINALDWNILYYEPALISNDSQLDSEAVLQSNTLQDLHHTPPQETKIVEMYLPMSLGAAKLKHIKDQLRPSPSKGLAEVEIYIESSEGYKKAKGTYWITSEIAQQYSKL